MRAVIAEAAAMGLTVLPDGSGLARVQDPPAGRAVAAGRTHPRAVCPMTLGESLADVRLKRPARAGACGARLLPGLDYDSRRVAAGVPVLRLSGQPRRRARRSPQDALARGAVAVASEAAPPEDRWRRAGSRWSTAGRLWRWRPAHFYGKPDERLGLTGITGTNGKTTTGFLIDSVLRAAGTTTALIGTIEYHLAGRMLPAVNTTPESLDLVRIFAELDGAGRHATPPWKSPRTPWRWAESMGCASTPRCSPT